MNDKLIQKLRDGEIGVSNSDYPVIEILEYAFPKSKTKINDLCGFHNPAIGFKASKDLKGSFNAIYVGESYTIPIYSVYAFMQDSDEGAGDPKFNEGGWNFKYNENVMVCVYTEMDKGCTKEWVDAIYIGKSIAYPGMYIAEAPGLPLELSFARVSKENIRPKTHILEVTMQEVADKFGVSVEQIKIKK